MVEGKRADMRRMGHEQNAQYKRVLAFVIFLIATLALITATFLNPIFMKKQIRTSYNQAVVVRQVNKDFDNLADLVDARKEDNSNLLANAKLSRLPIMLLSIVWASMDSKSIIWI